MSADDDPRVTDDPGEGRYELHLGDELAGFVVYRAEPGALVLVHTEVDSAFEGRGLGGRLVGGALDDIRARGLSVVAECPYARSYLDRHPEYADLVAGDGTAGS
jgi:predicted GNAT family acetyltransferase